MTVAVALVLCGAFAHAGWNLLAKAGTKDPRAFTLAYSLVVWILCLVPAGMSLRTPPSWSGVGLVALLGVGSGILHAVYALALQRAYLVSEMSLVYPVARGVGPVLAVLGGWAFMGDPTRWTALVGLGLVVLGIAVSAGDVRGGRTSVVYGGVVGLSIAAYTIWDQMSVDRFDADPTLYYFFTVSFQVVVLLSVMRSGALSRAAAATKCLPWVVMGVGILVPLSYLAVLFAMTMAPLSVIAPLRATSVVIGAVGACIIYKERGLLRRLCAAVVVCLGVAAISSA